MLVRLESSFNARYLGQALANFEPLVHAGCEVMTGGFNEIELSAFNKESELSTSTADIIILLIDASFFNVLAKLENPFGQKKQELLIQLGAEFVRLEQLIEQVTNNLPQSQVMINTLTFDPTTALGLVESNSSVYSVAEVYRELNNKIRELARERPNMVTFDLEAIIHRRGYDACHDRRLFYVTKSPFSKQGVQWIAEALGQVVLSLTRSAKKVIAVDLDNTLWGGVIGEDGLAGIRLGDDGPDRAFHDFQMVLRSFMSRGVLLAIVSKNNLEDAVSVFEQHPGMRLSLDHFSAVEINWRDKPTNLRRIAEKLNLDPSAFVFVDDSPVECEWMRRSLPEVEVVQLPEDPTDYAKALLELPSLQTVTVTDEDRRRKDLYATETARQEAQGEHASYEDFLSSLEIWMEVEEASASNLNRISQLVKKTNQFNLTNVRHDLGVLAEAMTDTDRCRIVAMRLGDRFGDYGIVGVAMLQRRGTCGVLEIFLLSCRVLGRGAETGFLHAVATMAREWGCSGLVGRYVASPKNGQTKEFYPENGFVRSGSDGEFVLTPIDVALPGHILFNAVDDGG